MALLHVRITAPPDRSDDVVALLDACAGVANLARLPGCSIRPAGDLIVADIARESVDDVVLELRALGIDRHGTLTLESLDAAVSTAAERAEDDAPGEGADAVIWEEVVRRTHADAALSWTFVVFLTLAMLLAGIAVLLDSAVLVIGAMVVGPEFGPLAAFAVGLVHRRGSLVREAVRTFAAGFAVALAVTTAATLLARLAGWVDAGMLDHDRPMTGFIWAPDRWSFVVAFIAGIAGVLALTSSKSGALVGVFISVTTVPAAGNLAVAAALGHVAELRGATAQLGINVAAIVVAGVLTLVVQRAVISTRRRIVSRAGGVGESRGGRPSPTPTDP